MYHEERMVDGVMCYRTDPNDNFTPYTLEQLSQRYAATCRQMSDQFEYYQELLGEK